MSSGSLPKSAIIQSSVYGQKACVVEDVERIRAHLKVGIPTKLEVLHQAQIDLIQARAKEVAYASGTEMPSRLAKGTRRKPLRLRLGQVDRSHLVRAWQNIRVRTHHTQSTGIGSCRAAHGTKGIAWNGRISRWVRNIASKGINRLRQSLGQSRNKRRDP